LATFSKSGAKVLACKTVSGFRNNNQFPLASFAPLLQACANPALAQSVDNPYFFDSDAGWGLGNVGTFIYATKIAQ
jgi:hypothetical protein